VALLIQHDPKAQEFTVELSGYRAVLQYRYADRVMTIAHIRVPAAVRGRGVAAELARSRKAGRSILNAPMRAPLCADIMNTPI
jgi:predicted GNAT family acetyltransferase